MNLADPISVLFIDDEAGQRELAEYWLGERWGFHVKTVKSTTEGLNELEVAKYEAVVTDFHMPELDGIEFLRKVRRDNPRLPFFFLSTKSRDKLIIDAMNYGADGFLLKSADVEPLFTDLASRIKTMVRRVREGEVLSEAIESLSRQSTTMSILNQIILEASHAEELPQMLERILAITISLMDFDGGGVYLVDERRKVARLVHHIAVPEGLAQLTNQVPLDVPPYSRIFIEKRPLFTEGEDETLTGNIRKFGYSSLCSIPILSRGKVIGALNLVRRRPYALTELDKSILVSIGLEMGGCLERVMGREEMGKVLANMEILFDSIDELIFIIEPNGTIVRANRSAIQNSGYSREELEGMDIVRLRPEGLRQETMDVLEAMRSRATLSKGEQLLRKDGSIVDMETQFSHGFWNRNEVLILVCRDITERKRYEDALQRSEEKLNLAIQGAEAGMWDWKVQTGELEVNENWTMMVGYTIAELEPMSIETWERLTHPDDLKMSYQLLESYFQGKIDRYECEIRMKHRNGQWIWVLDKGRISSRDEEGRPLRMNGTHVDITARKNTEDALIQVNNKLNLLSSINRHDIQNQIMILSGNISMVRSGDKRVDVPLSLEKMERAVMNIQRQIQFTKDYQSMGVKKPEWFNLSHVIKRGFDTLGLSEVGLEDRTDGYDIFADPLVEKVFYNLLENSIRHGGKVSKITTSCEKRHGHLVIIYQDDGVGISPENRKRLFEKGFGTNTGLGLFLSREILGITSIGITEKGEHGKGVRFELEVPGGAWRSSAR